MRIRKIAAILTSAALAAAAAMAATTTTYTYDSKGRLVQVSHAGTTNNGVIANYTYDATDNRTAKGVSGGP